MPNQDFLRRLPESDQTLRRRDRLQQRIHLDFWLLLLLITITAGGLVVLFSASDQSTGTIKRQGVYFIIAYIAMFVVAQVPVHFMRRLAPWAYVVAVGLLVLVIFYGVGAKGAQRWLSIGGFRFQPSELMKLAMPVAIAAYLGQRHLPPAFKHIFWTLVFVAMPVVLIIKQPDLGTSILVAASGLMVLFYAGISWRYILAALCATVLSIWPLWQFVLHDYQKRRVLTLLNPEADRLGAGWNIIQSKTAIGSGGVPGKGWLQGTQSHLEFLPEGHTDFIIAVLAEEFGLIGVLMLMGLYLLVVARGLTIALRAQDSFGRLLAASITLTFFVYVFVNIGMVSGLLPVVGVPLPLVSQGGTSLVTLMIGFGILMAIATEPRKVIR
ncbi:rod shape-determining protein RodA [Gilvimarinus agarilyticus]|uniref:rod shape-determining protein RodA n=1 Tax=unclassified Gilvimarinus TaxID=2642066 RepID=UPI001C095DA1|nr:MULTISPECIES: rod shape-determining protein RodA [unclassified Gilvimarinus]MBU2887615.1 rod shape-determining protein RodA [Gilvimarinus agarilyticus]MDO6572266.1 rod shape-determining protein RodA [Gilvimarinus sp. 2_MG-2023]MDO6746833.1 rod shape-determining protein RodA [Gilvimarinus sp. 1_MG-2023]